METKTKMNKNSKTDSDYWENRQTDDSIESSISYGQFEWLPVIQRHFSHAEIRTALELGCNPGYTTCAISNVLRNVKFSGIDLFRSDAYLTNLKSCNVILEDYWQHDATNICIPQTFDLVFSCGLVEHFDDLAPIIKSHVDLAKKEGYIFISIPNFRYVQYLYHKIFDNDDLSVHNLECMDTRYLKNALSQHNVDIVEYGYVGKLRFWNRQVYSNPITNILNRLGSLTCRVLARMVGIILPADSPYYSPWIYIIAKKR